MTRSLCSWRGWGNEDEWVGGKGEEVSGLGHVSLTLESIPVKRGWGVARPKLAKGQDLSSQISPLSLLIKNSITQFNFLLFFFSLLSLISTGNLTVKTHLLLVISPWLHQHLFRSLADSRIKKAMKTVCSLECSEANDSTAMREVHHNTCYEGQRRSNCAYSSWGNIMKTPQGGCIPIIAQQRKVGQQVWPSSLT